MGELVGAIVASTVLLSFVVRDLLVTHGRLVRELDSRGVLDDEVV